MAQEPFRKAEEEYFRLRGQFSMGRLTREQFETALRESMVQDAQGRYWVMGTDSGKWYVHNGTTWVEASPYGTTLGTPAAGPPPGLPERMSQMPPPSAAPRGSTPAPATQARSGGGCGGCLVKSCLLLIAAIVLVAVGGYLAFQSGAVTLTGLLALAGLGPGEVEVDNFRDDAIRVKIVQQDVKEDSFPAEGDLELNAFDVKRWRAGSSGRYRVDFTAADNSNLGTCTLTIRAGDQYQFVTMSEQVLVNRANSPSQVGTDFVISRSSLCR